MRLATGPYKPEGDWTGYFLRGDDALSLADQLRVLASGLSSGGLSPDSVAAALRGRAEQFDAVRRGTEVA